MKVKINGVDFNVQADWAINEKVGNPTNSTFKVLVENQELPDSGDVIQFLDSDANSLFFGLVGIPKSPAYSSPFEPKIYTLDCQNGNSILSRRLVNESFTNMNLGEIVEYLYDNYIEQEGITKGVISEVPIPQFSVYNCKNMNLLEVLNELAGFINGAWQVTNDKVFNFVKIDDFPACSQDVTKDTACFSALQRKDNARDLRTNQIIDGAFLTTDEQTEDFIVTEYWYGCNTVFPLVDKPKIYINGTQVSPDEIGIRGLTEGDTTRLFFWEYNSKQISVNPIYEGSTTLQEGDTVQVRYIGLAPIRIEVLNEAKAGEIAEKTGLSGIIDNVLVDPTIVTREDAMSKANSLLELYGSQQHTITARTDLQSAIRAGFLASDFNLYTQWHFDYPELDFEGDFVLTEKKVQPLVLDDETSFVMTLTFTDRNFIQSYGETITNLYRDVTKLSVREDVSVITNVPLEYEYLRLGETIDYGRVLPLLVCDTMQNGQTAQPLGTLVPNLVVGYNEWRDKFTVYVTSSDTGEICTPMGDAWAWVCEG